MQFRNVRPCTKPNAVSGEYNAKNSYGAYVGFKPFIYADGRTWVGGDDDGLANDYEGMSKLCYSDSVLAETAKELAKLDIGVGSPTPEESPSPMSSPVDPVPAVPVTTPGGELGGCLNGQVNGLAEGGDGFLAVRAAPDINSRRTDQIGNDQAVFMCAEHGKWLGIVYSYEPDDCGLDTLPVGRSPYTGHCKTGWVYRKWIERFAD